MHTVTQQDWINMASQLGTVCLCLAYPAMLALMIMINLAAIACDETLRRISNNYAQRHKDDCYDI